MLSGEILKKNNNLFVWRNFSFFRDFGNVHFFIITNKTRTYEIVQKIKVAHHLTDPIGISFEQSVCLNCYIRKLHFQNVRNL